MTSYLIGSIFYGRIHTFNTNSGINRLLYSCDARMTDVVYRLELYIGRRNKNFLWPSQDAAAVAAATSRMH